MKNVKTLIIFSCLFLVSGAVVIAGCLDSGSNNSTNTTTPPIEDAAIYRGIVVEVTNSSNQLNVTLEKAEGTNFADSKSFLITDSTNMKFNKSDIKKGKYLEVYFTSMEEDNSTPTAIAVNLLPDADKCVYNGVLQNITADESDSNAGTITLKLKNDENSVTFSYSSSTQFYLNVSDLKEGDLLNIYAPSTMSSSPYIAQEVRIYN